MQRSMMWHVRPVVQRERMMETGREAVSNRGSVTAFRQTEDVSRY